VVLPDGAIPGERHQEGITRPVHTLPGRRPRQVLVAVPARLRRRIRDQLEDPLRAGGDLPSGGDYPVVRWRVEDGGYELGVQVLGELYQLAVAEPAHIAVLVVIALPAPGLGVAAALNHHPLAFGDEALGGVAVTTGELGEQRLEQLLPDRFLACVLPRPGRIPGDDPPEVVGHQVGERPPVPLGEVFEGVPHQLLVVYFVGRGHAPDRIRCCGKRADGANGMRRRPEVSCLSVPVGAIGMLGRGRGDPAPGLSLHM